MSPRQRKKWPKRHAGADTVANVRVALHEVKKQEGDGLVIKGIVERVGVRAETVRDALKQIGAVVVREIKPKGRGARTKVWGLP